MTKTVIKQAKDESRAVARLITGYAERIDKACTIAYHNSQMDGAHHKMWCIDQMIRVLQGDKYDDWVNDATNDGTEEWDTGIAP